MLRTVGLAASLLLVTASAVAQDRTAEARGLFDAGRAAYEAGRYEDALDYFTRCHEITGEPALLYNMARAAELAGQLEPALAHYAAYRPSAPASEHAEIDEHLSTVRAELARRAALTDPEPVGPPEQPVTDGGSGPGAGPWIVIGVGGAAVVAGAVLLGLSVGAADAVNGAEGVDWSTVRGDYDDAVTFSTAGAVLLSVGGAALAAGLIWAIVELGAERSAEVAIGPGNLHLRGRF